MRLEWGFKNRGFFGFVGVKGLKIGVSCSIYWGFLWGARSLCLYRRDGALVLVRCARRTLSILTLLLRFIS